MIKIGSYVEDMVTGLRGRVSTRAEYLDGSTRVEIEGMGNDNRPWSLWREEAAVLVVDVEKEQAKAIAAGA